MGKITIYCHLPHYFTEKDFFKISFSGACIFNIFEFSEQMKLSIPEILQSFSNNKNIIITDSLFCFSRYREFFIDFCQKTLPNHELSFVFFPNDPLFCISNLLSAQQISEYELQEINNIYFFSKNY